jgi:hypothetical protein
MNKHRWSVQKAGLGSFEAHIPYVTINFSSVKGGRNDRLYINLLPITKFKDAGSLSSMPPLLLQLRTEFFWSPKNLYRRSPCLDWRGLIYVLQSFRKTSISDGDPHIKRNANNLLLSCMRKVHSIKHKGTLYGEDNRQATVFVEKRYRT